MSSLGTVYLKLACVFTYVIIKDLIKDFFSNFPHISYLSKTVTESLLITDVSISLSYHLWISATRNCGFFPNCLVLESLKMFYEKRHWRTDRLGSLVHHHWKRRRYRISFPSSPQYFINKIKTLPQNVEIPRKHFHFHSQFQKLLLTTL